MFDVEEALRLNREGSVIAREMNFPEGDANSQINLALNYLCLNEPDSAREHLAAAETLLAQDEWFRWVYTIRFQAAYAEYWLMKGDPAEAARYATASFNLAGVTRRRKHIAWASKLLGDVAAMEDRPQEAVAHYQAGFPSWIVTGVRPFSGRFWLPLRPFIPSSTSPGKPRSHVQRHDVRSVNSPDRSGRLLYRVGSQDREWRASTGLPDRAIAHTIVSPFRSSAVAVDRQPCDLFKHGRCWYSRLYLDRLEKR
jgi:hypothetical protein